MTAWDSYNARLEAKGGTLRGARLQRESNYINRKLPDSLSYHTALVNGVEQQLAIINSDNLEIKTVISLPGEDILNGSLVEWAENYWIVVREDPNKELYTKTIMQQCNHLLKWITLNENVPEIIQRWCYISDGTKYLTGETVSSYNDNGMSLGDTRISMLIARDSHTVKLNRNNRFIIDDIDSERPLAYRLTKPFKVGGVFNNRGAMGFVLTEVNTEDDDNLDLHIADYYAYFPTTNGDNPPTDDTDDGRGSWL